MKVWVDAHLSPAVATWMTRTLGVDASCVRDLRLRDAEDTEIFFAARKANAVVMTKDSDFLDLLARHGPPPRVIWLTIGNTSNARLRVLLSNAWPDVARLLEAGERLVELRG